MKKVLSSLAIALMLAAPPAGAMQHEGGDHNMMMHHQHMLMNHGLSMVLDGSNLIMLGGMKMSESLDPLTVEHGKAMGPGKDPMMKQTHDMAETAYRIIDLPGKMINGM